MDWATEMHQQFIASEHFKALRRVESEARDAALMSGAMPGEFRIALVVIPIRQAGGFGGRFKAVLR